MNLFCYKCTLWVISMTEGNALENIWLANVVFSSKCVVFQRVLWEMWLGLFLFCRIRCQNFHIDIFHIWFQIFFSGENIHWNIKEILGLIKYMQPYQNIMHQYDLFNLSQMHINVWISAQSKWSSKWEMHKKWDKNGERRFWAIIGECQMKRRNWRPQRSDLILSFIMWTHWNCQMYLHINGLHGLPWDRRAGRHDGKAENSSILFYFRYVAFQNTFLLALHKQSVIMSVFVAKHS